MKKILILTVLGSLTIISCNVFKGLDAPADTSTTYFMRANGSADGKLTLKKTVGSLQLGSSGLDVVYDIVISKTNGNGPAKIDFKRKGSYSQSFFGWMSTDEKQISGYFESGGKKFPFACSSENDVTYSSEKQTSLDGTWNIRCNGTALGKMVLLGKGGTFQVGSSKNDKIAITKQETTGKSGALTMELKRTGSYNQVFQVWVSTDKKQMSGYYESGGKNYPFYGYKK